jgi:hypothetical protein
VRVRRCSVDLFVGVRDLESIIVLQDREQRHPIQARAGEFAEFIRRQIAGLDSKRFLATEPEPFDFNEPTRGG